ncbi:MAG: asparagine--tRNA ligase [Desulfobulbaceae bacterium]|jgi:asparaginyl-tRNA synthetase|nr:asparagine--tRNA ligase [Desulfobulbaceae bacterium]
MRNIAGLLANPPLDQSVEITGWLRTRRDAASFSFLEINDGSCLANIQVIVGDDLANYHSEIKKLATGCALRVVGTLRASPAKGQAVEIAAAQVELIGAAGADYPLQKKRHSPEFLRTICHLRPRTNAIGAVMRVRSRLAFATHQFFQERGFVQTHTPIITTSDCEGAGEMFEVVTGQGDFFGKPAGLTVSGQLQAEAYALALGKVYTFGPTFRAENSNTSRHLAEFWMIEPEMAFCDLQGDMAMAVALLKYLVADALKNCAADLELFDAYVEKGLLAKLRALVEQDFIHLTYDQAIEQLLAAPVKFSYPVHWGIDPQSEHERYLCEERYKAPLIITDYPAAIKPFYMRLSDDGRTVAAMDILVPGIGEIIGGSQREERLDVLEKRMLAAGMNLDDYAWYLDLRRYGSAPHAGFGLGFERLVRFVSGMANIRDVIAFPRAPGFAPC